LKKRPGYSWAILIFLLLWVGIGGFPPQAFSKSASETQKKLKQEQQRLEVLREKIRATQEEKEKAGKKERSLLKTLEQSDQTLQLRRQELSVIELRLKQSQEELEALSLSIGGLQGEIENQRERLKKRLRAGYIAGKEASLSLFLEANDGNEMGRRYRYLKWISEREAQLLREYERSMETLQVQKDQLAEVQENKKKTFEGKQAKIAEIEKDRVKRRQLLVKLRKELSSREKLLKELEDSAAHLQTLIGRLTQEKGKASIGRGFARLKGRLGWPSGGPVVTFYGRQKHLKFDTLVFKKGIEIEAKQGDPIQAVFDGKVVYADWFKGYGILIILDHGDHYFSLYAHAAKNLVSVGDQVREKQVIGEIGETGFTQETKLYFEIRHRGQPQDPLPWLQRRPNTIGSEKGS